MQFSFYDKSMTLWERLQYVYWGWRTDLKWWLYKGGFIEKMPWPHNPPRPRLRPKK